MGRETDQHGRSAREATKDNMDPCGRRKSGQQKKANVVRLSLDLALERDLADWVADGQGEALDRRKPAASAHDKHEENSMGSRDERTPQR